MASEKTVPGWYREISTIAFVWYLLSLGVLWSHVNMSHTDLLALSDSQRASYAATPTWATIAYCVAVCAGLVGAVGLLMRKAWAVQILYISLLGVLCQMAYTFILRGSEQIFPLGGLIIPLMVTGIAVFLVWFATYMNDRDWLD